MKECRLDEEARVADWQAKHDEFLAVIHLCLPDWLAIYDWLLGMLLVVTFRLAAAAKSAVQIRTL